jgi:hypothetical protein
MPDRRPALQLDWDQVIGWRLRRHHLDQRAPGGDMLAVVAELAGSSPAPSVRLLPAFDQYVIAVTRHAEQLMPGPFKDRVYRLQGWLSPVLLDGGRMLGTWRQEPKGRRVLVTIEPFAKLRATVRRQAEAEAERLATWTGAGLDLAWAGTVA